MPVCARTAFAPIIKFHSFIPVLRFISFHSQPLHCFQSMVFILPTMPYTNTHTFTASPGSFHSNHLHFVIHSFQYYSVRPLSSVVGLAISGSWLRYDASLAQTHSYNFVMPRCASTLCVHHSLQSFYWTPQQEPLATTNPFLRLSFVF